MGIGCADGVVHGESASIAREKGKNRVEGSRTGRLAS
jgi:hypothetical protein